jgi:hypothetical protein
MTWDWEEEFDGGEPEPGPPTQIHMHVSQEHRMRVWLTKVFVVAWLVVLVISFVVAAVGSDALKTATTALCGPVSAIAGSTVTYWFSQRTPAARSDWRG